MKASELIAALQALMDKHGDLPCGGENDPPRVKVCACDDEGYDADGEYSTGPATMLFLEVY